MGTIVKWEAPATIATVMSTELNSLANGANAITASALSNDAATTERFLYASFEFYIAAQGSARSAGAYVALFLLPEIDGTNFAYGGAGLNPQSGLWLCNFSLDAATTARYCLQHQIPIPPHNFHLVMQNNTGQAFAASGNTLKWVRYSLDTP